MLRVRLIGRPSAALGVEPLAWPAGRRAGELLAWLALRPGAHARADLAPRFWPDVLDASARASLRTALHELRAALGPGAAVHLVATREAVALDDDAWVDVRAVRAALDEGRDDDALALAGDGELLLGIDADWVGEARREHRALLDAALGRAAERAAESGDAAGAAAAARRRVLLDPLAEAAARDLMRLLADAGDRAAAMAAYEDLRARMARELRAAPSPATRDLAARLRGGGPAEQPSAGPRRLAERLAEEERRTFVGRAAELTTLRSLVAAERPPVAVAFVSGPGGTGKTRLLRAALAAPPDGVRVVALDCAAVEPTPGGFLTALCAALGTPAADPGAALAAELVAGAGRRVVLALDTYETFGLVDAWLRGDFLPMLPERALTIIAGREPPGRRWLAAPGWQGLVRHLPLGPLGDEDALRLLAARGLPADAAARANAFARGHPLALELAASALEARPGLEPADGPPAAVVAQLVEVFLEGLDPAAVRALRAAALLRRVDEGLLRAVLDGDDPERAYGALRALPFCEETAEGLAIHDAVRDAVARDAAHRDPARVAAARRRAADAILARAAGGPRLWQATADLLHLVANPAVREAFFPRGAADIAVEPAAPSDADAVRAIAAAWEPPEATAAIAAWWEAHPEAFTVARGPGGALAGFGIQIGVEELNPALERADPVVRRWSADLAGRPLGPDERALLARRFLSATHGDALSPALAALFLDIKRLYMEMRPALRRMYAVGAGTRDLRLLGPLGFTALDGDVVLGDVAYRALLLDFGPGSVDGWLGRLVRDEARRPADAALTAG